MVSRLYIFVRRVFGNAFPVFSRRYFIVLLPLLAVALSSYGQQITPQMIEQFQRLPKAQQEALAREHGIDLDVIRGSQSDGLDQSDLGQPSEPLRPQNIANKTDTESTLIRMLLAAESSVTEEDPQEVARYGMELFDAEISTFAPVDNALVPDEYKLGTGDTLVVQLFGKENDQYSLVVNRSGEINFPRFGPISVAGLTYQDAEALIKKRVEEQLIGVDAVVSMGRLRAISVFMAGEVNGPGSYAVSALTTVSQALFVAGGVSDIGSLRHIEVKRSSETIGVFDVYDLLMRGDASNDLRLQSGDVVFVPPYSGLVEIEGAVRRPMIYELNDSSETINDLIAMAGGFKTDAHRSSAVLERAQNRGLLPELKNLDLNSAADLSVALRDGDRLRVPVVADYFDNQISVDGAVVRPGNYAWYSGIRVSDLIRSVESDLLPEVDLGYALIVRIKNARRDIEVYQFDLGEAIFNKGSQADLLLNKQDQLLVFGLADEEVLAEEAEKEFSGRSDQSSEEEIEVHQSLITEAYQADIKESDTPTFKRQELLKLVLAKLRSQAREGEPVQIVSISGAVKVPGEYPLKEGDQLFDLVRAAGGLHDSAYLEGAEFRRVSELNGGIQSEFIEVSLKSIRDIGSAENIALQSRDHLTVREVPDWTPNKTVTLKGEVRFPGTYLFGRGETLGEVIDRAGGLTDEGFAAGAVFTREVIRVREEEQAKRYAEQILASYAASILTREEEKSNYPEIELISKRLEDYQGIGRMLIDLESILAGENSIDISLLDGDEIFVPERSESVAVIGEVQRAATHSYQSGFDVNDYLELSAGITKRADDESTYIVKANGSVIISGSESWFKFSSRGSRLEPGDTIVVPIDSEYKDRWSFWTDVTQIFYQSGLAIAAILAI